MDGELIGLIFCDKTWYAEGRRLFIEEFAIKDFQGNGYNTRALKHIESMTGSGGFAAIELTANIKWKAARLYEMEGFRKTDYVLMEKYLKG